MFLGLLSALLGVLILVPRFNRQIWTAQVVLTELPILAAVPGVLAWVGRSSRIGRLLGLVGIACSVVPYTGWRRSKKQMDAMLQEAFGADYVESIPPQLRKRMQPTRSLIGNLKHLLWEDDVEITHDVVFAETPQRTLKCDIYQPQVEKIDGRAYPAVIVIHAGGWRRGDKGKYFAVHNRALAAQGYVVFDIQHRLTKPDRVRWPVLMADVRSAVRFVKNHAETYDVDPSRVALYGRSSGSHLALSTAFRARDDHADTAVQAVIAAYGPTDLMLTGPKHDERVLMLLGATAHENPDIYHDASPLEFVDAAVPPTLILQGGKDGLVPMLHAELLYNRMQLEPVRCALLRVPWARHGFDAVRIGSGAQLTQYYVDRFLARSLYGTR
jgi:acetyl esterase/lipase